MRPLEVDQRLLCKFECNNQVHLVNGCAHTEKLTYSRRSNAAMCLDNRAIRPVAPSLFK